MTDVAVVFSSSRPIIHLNHAGASPSPPEVVNRIWEHLQLEQRVGGYQAADLVHTELEAVYTSVAQLVQCQPSEIALVESATVGWTRFFYAVAEHLERQPRVCWAEQQQQQQQQQQQRLHPDSTTTPSDDDPTAAALSRSPPPPQKRRVILVSQAEYAANLVAVCQWCQRHRPHWTVYQIPSIPGTGQIDVSALNDMLTGQFDLCQGSSTSINAPERNDPCSSTSTSTSTSSTRLDPESIAMVCITHIPTNSGLINPVEKIGQLLQAYNLRHRSSSGSAPIVYLVDTCQSIGQRPVSVRDLHCHGLVGTGRKYLQGPRGTGFLYVSSSVLNLPPGHPDDPSSTDLWPSHLDHFAAPVRLASFPSTAPPPTTVPGSATTSTTTILTPVQELMKYAPRLDARRFEFWESSVALRLGLGVAVQRALHRGLEIIAHDICNVANYLYDLLNQVKHVHIPYQPECGILTFYVDQVESQFIQEALWNHHNNNGTTAAPRFQVSVSPTTSTPLDSSVTHVPDLLRVSVHDSTTRTELDLFVTALSDIIQTKVNKDHL